MNKDIRKKLEYLIGNLKVDEYEREETLKQVIKDMNVGEAQDSTSKESVSIGGLVVANIDQLTSGKHQSNVIKNRFQRL
jgi:hypothetical protein